MGCFWLRSLLYINIFEYGRFKSSCCIDHFGHLCFDLAGAFTHYFKIVQNYGHRETRMDHCHVVCVLGCFRLLLAFGAAEEAVRC